MIILLIYLFFNQYDFIYYQYIKQLATTKFGKYFHRLRETGNDVKGSFSWFVCHTASAICSCDFFHSFTIMLQNYVIQH